MERVSGEEPILWNCRFVTVLMGLGEARSALSSTPGGGSIPVGPVTQRAMRLVGKKRHLQPARRPSPTTALECECSSCRFLCPFARFITFSGIEIARTTRCQRETPLVPHTFARYELGRSFPDLEKLSQLYRAFSSGGDIVLDIFPKPAPGRETPKSP